MIDERQADASDGPSAPPMPDQVLQVVRTLLGNDGITGTDKFFEVGGNSILAVRLVVQLRRVLGVQVSVRQIFELGTAERIALAYREDGPAATSPRPLESGTTRPEASGAGRSLRDPALQDSFVFPASYGQQRMWFLAQLDPATGRAYHLRSAVQVDGPLEIDLLRQAFDVLVRRHEVLRTRFLLLDAEEATIGEQLVQVITPTGEVPVHEIDLTGRSDQEVWQALTADSDALFDLDSGPLLRGCVARIGPHRHVLQLTMHHIIGDGWSMAVLGQELSTACAALAAGHPPEFAELPIQYADFATWQREQQDTPEYQEHLNYWRRSLATLPVLDLPTDRPRPEVPSYRGAQVPVHISADLLSSATAFARSEGATPFMVLLAAWQAVLGRLSGGTDFGVGTPLAGRGQPETDRLIGFFVNTVVLRSELSGDPTFQELVHRARERAFDAYLHQDIPFEKLVDELGIERDLSRSPLFQVWFAYQDTPPASLELPGARVEPVRAPVITAPFDLSLVLHPDDDDVTGWLRYSTDLFEEPTAHQLALQWQALLAGAIADPRTPVSALPLPDEARDGPVRYRSGDTGQPEPEPAGTAPPTPVAVPQDKVLEVVRRLLGRDDITATDRFFEAGGSSILAARLVVELRRVLDVRISVKQIFELATVERIALAHGPDRPAIRPRPAGAVPVLSFDQQRLWLENVLRPQAAYNVHGRRRLVGNLDKAALERATAAILARHEALRSRFPSVNYQPVQVVDDPDENWRIDFADVSRRTEDRDPAARRLADEQAATVFDLERGPLFRCLLVRLSDTEHLLGITAHHSVCDGWSIDLFLSELAELYRAGGDAARAELPVLPIQYLDYAVWQRDWLTGATLDAHLAYWRKQLGDLPETAALPVARRRSTHQGVIGGRVSAGLTREQTAAVHELCRAQGVTPFMVVLAAMATVLSRWSDRPDVVIGTPISTRNDPGTHHLIGLFVNTLPMRLDLSGDPTFADLLQQVHTVVADGAVQHGETPLNLLVDELRLPRDPTRTPLFEICLTMLNLDERGTQLGDIAVEPARAPELPSTFDLNLFVQEHDGKIQFAPTFHADRYDAELIRSFLDQLAWLVQSAAADPTLPVRAYPLQDGTSTAGPAQPAAGVGDPVVDTGANSAGDWAVDRFDLTAADRFAVLSGSADVVGCALGTARAAGATVLVPPDPSLVPLLDWLRSAEVSVVHLTAPTLRALAALSPAPALTALRYAFVVNDGTLSGQDPTALARISPTCRLIGVHDLAGSGRPVTVFETPGDWRQESAPLRLPLGTAVDGIRIDLITPAGLSAAIGEIGEIHAAGRPTGSAARRRPDGTLELADRAGGPLDPASTVAALRDRPEVDDAVVTTYLDDDGQVALAAYVACSGPKPGIAVLRQHLVTRVRADLLPQKLFLLDRLPLDPAGEYDLAALTGTGVSACSL